MGSSTEKKAYVPEKCNSYTLWLLWFATFFKISVIPVKCNLHLTDREWNEKLADTESQEYDDLCKSIKAMLNSNARIIQ